MLYEITSYFTYQNDAETLLFPCVTIDIAQCLSGEMKAR